MSSSSYSRRKFLAAFAVGAILAALLCLCGNISFAQTQTVSLSPVQELERQLWEELRKQPVDKFMKLTAEDTRELVKSLQSKNEQFKDLTQQQLDSVADPAGTLLGRMQRQLNHDDVEKLKTDEAKQKQIQKRIDEQLKAYMPERMTGYLQNFLSKDEKTQAEVEEYLKLSGNSSKTAEEAERYTLLGKDKHLVAMAAMQEYLTLHFKPTKTAQEKDRYIFLDERLKANEQKFAASSERIYGTGIKTSEAVVTTAHKEFVKAQLDARKEAVAKKKADEKAARDKELADKATAKELARLPLNPNLPKWLNPRLHQLPGWFEGNSKELSDGGKEMLSFFEKNPQVMNDVGLMMLDLDKNKSYQDFCNTEVKRFSKRVEEEARKARHWPSFA